MENECNIWLIIEYRLLSEEQLENVNLEIWVWLTILSKNAVLINFFGDP